MGRLRSEDGFTLNELLVVIVLLGIILGVAYGGFYVVNGGVRISDRQAHFTGEISGPLDALERVVMQQVRIINDYPVDPQPYQLAVSTDMDSDEHYETQFIRVTADHRLILERSEEIDQPTTDELTISENNYNVEAGVPLFRYFDAAGTELTIDQMGQVSSKAFSVVITIVTEFDGEQFSDSRTVLFRN